MFFNSVDFAIFLPVVFMMYWFVFNKSIRVQNALLIVASYFFYGLWDWRFLFLILFSTIIDFTVAKAIIRQNDKKLLSVKKIYFLMRFLVMQQNLRS